MFKKYISVFQCIIFFLFISASFFSYGQKDGNVRHDVTLKQAHVGSLYIDTLLLDSYGLVPANIRQFYLDARFVLSENGYADFTHPEILESAQKNKIGLMGGPMLGNLTDNGVTIWLRPSVAKSILIKVYNSDGNEEKSFSQKGIRAGVAQRIKLNGLASDTDYNYVFFFGKDKLAEGTFRIAPNSNEAGLFKLAFGSCMHKIGVHNPNLVNQILKRKPQAMVLLGDIAVDDRENNFNLHQADYLLRDVSKPWQRLAANVPLYTSWDDHDYLNNDLSGIPDGFSESDRKMLREVWEQNWNNPLNKKEGGIRVPGVLEWPDVIKEPASTSAIAVTTDFMQTLAELTNQPLPDRPLDGKSMVPIFKDPTIQRNKPHYFWQFNRDLFDDVCEPYIDSELQEGTTPLAKMMDGKYTRTFRNCKYSAISEEDFAGERVMMKDRYKLIVEGQTPNEKGYELYDIQNNPEETKNLADKYPEIVEKMQIDLREWQESVLNSLTGADYK